MNRKKVTMLAVLLALITILSVSLAPSVFASAETVAENETFGYVPADASATDKVLGAFVVVKRDVPMYESSSGFGSGECTTIPVDLVFCVNGVAYLNDDGTICRTVYHTYSKEYIWTGKPVTLEDEMHETIYAAPHFMIHVTDECGNGGWLFYDDLEWDIRSYFRCIG